MGKSNSATRWFVCTVFLFAGSLANAVQPRLYQLGDGGAIAPHLRIEVGNDSNVLRRNEGSDPSSFFHIVPSLKYVVQQRNNRLTAEYAGDYYFYGEDYCLVPKDVNCPNGSPQYDKASFQNHTFTLNGFIEISRQLRASLEVQQALAHQPVGTGLSSNSGFLSSLQEPVSYDNRLVRALVSYGAAQARGEVRFSLTHTDRNFDSYDNLSESSLAPSATVLYRVGNKVQLLGGISESGVTGGNSERKVTRQFAGVEIDASAITSGTFQVKNTRENFDGSRGDLEYVGWDLGISWKPRRYSTVSVSGGRETSRGLFNLDTSAATVVGEDYGISTVLDVDWNHYWKDRFSTDVGVQWQQNKTVSDSAAGVLGSDASDVTTTIRLQGNYNLRRWLDVGAFFTSDVRDGQSADRDYERTLFGITTNGTF